MMRTIILLCLSANMLWSQSLDKVLNQTAFDHSIVGLSVKSTIDGSEVYGHYEDILLTPASTLKLLTTLTAIEQMGSDYTYETVVGYTGNIGKDGTLKGNVVIKGSGDPTLGSNRWKSGGLDQLLKRIVVAIHKAGITCIDGEVLVDDSKYSGQNVPGQWWWYDLGNYYASGAWATNINENLYRVHFGPTQEQGSKTTVKHLEPFLSQVTITNNVTAGPPKSGDNAYVYGGPFQKERIIRGTIPPNRKSFNIKASIPNPPLALAELVYKALEENKIKTSHGYRVAAAPLERQILKITSAPLGEIVKRANAQSNNLYCDAIGRELSVHASGDGSIDHGAEIVEKALLKKGISPKTFEVKDGSGLAATNKITTGSMADFLIGAKKAIGGKVLSYIPQVGNEGTVSSMLKDEAIAKNFYLKSGSFEGVLAYAGYYKGKSGKSYAISITINNHAARYSSLKKAIENVLRELYKRT